MIKVERIRKLNTALDRQGPIIYWMSRDIRVHDNWALLFAAQKAKALGQPLAVVFCLRQKFDLATDRLVWWLLESCKEVLEELEKYNIPFFFLQGAIEEEIPAFVRKNKVGAVVSDFSPVKYSRGWKKHLSKLEIPLYEVDAHNIVPVWTASPKQEFGAYTLRPKLKKLLPEFLTVFPKLQKSAAAWKGKIKQPNWEYIYKTTEKDTGVKRVEWLRPGEKAGLGMLRDFLDNRLRGYAENRNDPSLDGQSGLSPYIHFGNLSSQTIALAIESAFAPQSDKDAYLEELIIRKELSDNYCFYNDKYDSVEGFPAWAQKTIMEHRGDIREYTYTLKVLEHAQTHDELWNAAQLEMVTKGKMHGYMRMYWAKKLLEWTKSPEEALKWGIYLNDKYELDGGDPNGYVGLAWSIGGLHDRAWFERPIFGKIRYMSYGGAKSKFNIKEYISQVS